MKLLFKHQDLQMFDFKLTTMRNFHPLQLWVVVTSMIKSVLNVFIFSKDVGGYEK